MSDFPERYTDMSGRVCPDCKSVRITYVLIPPHRRKWETDREGWVEHFGEARDYTCRNCEAEWTMFGGLFDP